MADDFPLLVASARQFHPSISAWFTSGFHNYFRDVRTDFIRPVVNLSFYLCSLLFGFGYDKYVLILNYMPIALLTGAAAYLFRCEFGCTPIRTVVFATLAFFTPALYTVNFFSPSFAFDGLSAALVILGLCCLLAKRTAWAWVLLSVAVFTKETALFAPVFVALLLLFGILPTPAYLRNRYLSGTLFLTPVLAWVILRERAFRGGGLIYVLGPTSAAGYCRRAVSGLTHWPLSLPTHFRISIPLTIGVNSLFWVLVLTLAFRKVTQIRNAGSNNSSSLRIIVVTTFAAGSLLMPIGLALAVRFHIVDFVHLLLFLVLALQTAANRREKIASVCCLLLLCTCTLFAQAAFWKSISFYERAFSLSRQLLQMLHNDSSSTIYLVDDATAPYGAVLAKLTQYPGHLVQVSRSSIPSHFTTACVNQPQVVANLSADGTTLVIHEQLSPSCASRKPMKYCARCGDDLNVHTVSSGESTAEAIEKAGPMDFTVTHVPPGSFLIFPDLGRDTYIKQPLPGFTTPIAPTPAGRLH